MNKNWSSDRKRIKEEKARLWSEQKREWEKNRKEVLRLRYNKDGSVNKSLSEIAEIRGITRSRVIQILKYEREKGNGRSKDD
jgi:DNA-directed RNA polymerase specialized sigma subunit